MSTSLLARGTLPGPRAVNFWCFLRFSLVGVVGFTVDGGALHALIELADWGPIEARAVAVPIAVLATWLLNRRITFRDLANLPAFRSLVRYATVSGVGAAVNFSVYVCLVFGFSAMAAKPLMALAIASTVALMFNFLGSKHFAFR